MERSRRERSSVETSESVGGGFSELRVLLLCVLFPYPLGRLPQLGVSIPFE